MTASPRPDGDSLRTKRRRWPWVVAFSLVGVLLVGGGIAAAYAWSLISTFDSNATKLDDSEAFPEATVRPAPVETQHAGAKNILLLGSDVRGEVGDDLGAIRGQRSDSMMVVHIPADGGSVQVMSIMRDTWVPIPNYGEAKINSALSLGGVPLTVQTIESIIDVRIDHVAIVDFEGFEGLTDALGGVEVNNSIAFTREGVNYPAGPITLGGEEALGFVRERYSFTDGDYQRVRNQQAYIKGLIGTLLSRDALTNPATISDVVGAVSPYLTVDSGMDAGFAIDLASRLGSLTAENITFFTAPTLGTGTSADGQSIVLPDWAGLDLVSEAFRTDTVAEYAASIR